MASAKALGTVLHLMRGTPYVYQGEELGMANVPFDSIADFRDIETLNHYAEAVDIQGQDAADVMAALRRTSRDNARTPMQWSDERAAGFTTGTPWIPANPDYPRVNAAAETADPDSVFAHYRRLIELRHESPVVADGDFTPVLEDHPQVFGYRRALDGRELLVLVNLTGAVAQYDTAELVEWHDAAFVLGNLAGSESRGVTGSLEPWEALVFRLR